MTVDDLVTIWGKRIIASDWNVREDEIDEIIISNTPCVMLEMGIYARYVAEEHCSSVFS